MVQGSGTAPVFGASWYCVRLDTEERRVRKGVASFCHDTSGVSISVAIYDRWVDDARCAHADLSAIDICCARVRPRQAIALVLVLLLVALYMTQPAAQPGRQRPTGRQDIRGQCSETALGRRPVPGERGRALH